MVSRRLAALALVLVGTVLGNGCGTGAVDVGACRQVEEARCHQAPACNIVLTPPNYTGGSAVDACVRYYDDACLHGLVVAGGPSAGDLSACVAAITSDSNAQDCCSTVKEPQSNPACRWLDPAPTDSSAPPTACD